MTARAAKRLDTAAIDRIFASAEAEGRDFLLEAEVYAMLRAAGLSVPRHRFIPKGGKATAADLAPFTNGVVLKIVAPLIQHKTDVGGVAFAEAVPGRVNAALKAMIAEVPGRTLDWARTHPHGRPGTPTREAVAADIRGVLLVEKVPYEKFGFGSELLLGVRNSREFGPVLTLGAGGVETEYLAGRLKAGAALASAHLLAKGAVLGHLASTAVFDKLVRPFRGAPAPLDPAVLRGVYERFRGLALRYSPFRPSGRYVIEEAEVNPFVVRDGRLLPLDGLCRFSRTKVDIRPRPAEGIRALLHPASIAVIGVSEKMNLGRIILRNILEMGFPADRVTVVKPGLAGIDGCRCVPTVADLPETVDLFVLTLAADQCEPVMRALTDLGKARSVIIIAGGMGEKEGTKSIEAGIQEILSGGRRAGRLTPVVNGGNCLGIYSRPGSYDTTFIPRHKLRFPKTGSSGLAYVSQSGAFLISRVSRLRRFAPLYGISLGNQIDLRVSDYLRFLKDEPDVKVFAVYVEGFKPGDGYLLAEAARDIVRTPGRFVIAYKSGRSPEGRLATSSHTASIAGEYGVCKAVLEEAGVLVAETIAEFESWVAGAVLLGGRRIAGPRVGLMSNAGFESVIMADGLGEGPDRLRLASFAPSTRARMAEALGALGIDRIQDVKNPLDTTPVADDAAFAACARAMLEDPGVDCAVVSPVPMTPAMRTLAPGESHRENIFDPGSTPSRLIELFRATDKPFVVNIDAGLEYDPMAGMLEEAEVPVFRRSDEAMGFLRGFVGARLRASRRR